MKKTNKKERDFIMFLEDISDSIEKIEKYTDKQKEEFFANEISVDATTRRLEIIGEAIKNIPADFKRKHKEIDWKNIVGMRNILIHEYFGVNKEKLWKVIKKDIPELKIKMLKIFEELKINK